MPITDYPLPNLVDRYDSLQLVMFSGKGGVGKTTLSCGFARRWARQFPQQTILLLSTDPAHSLGDVLQTTVDNAPRSLCDLPNLQIRALDARELLEEFKRRYGEVLQLLVERGSFAEAEDLTPAWDLSWPGLDELMGILEIQRLLGEKVADRVVVDMAPSGHARTLLGLMDFLDNFLQALDLFQEKHRAISKAFTGGYSEDEADDFLRKMQEDLAAGRGLLQDEARTNCLVVALAEPMSLLETQRFLESLAQLNICVGGLSINQIVEQGGSGTGGDRYSEQQHLLEEFRTLAGDRPVFSIPKLDAEPLGGEHLDRLISQIQPISSERILPPLPAVEWPEKILPSLTDFIAEGRKLIVVGGKGGVGKTTVAAGISWGMAQCHPDKNIRVISIDPAHSLGDAFGQKLGHEPTQIADNLSGEEIDAEQMLGQFREEYLWELADMISGETADSESPMELLYGPEAWRKIVDRSLPGIDEILALLAVMDLLEKQSQDLIILDTAPTGHLLRFLEMPTALTDWLAWIFKLWIKYQDVLGRTEFMGRLRTLRKRVVNAQKLLKDGDHTEFIGVFQARAAIIAEQVRLTEALAEMGINQRYLVQNCFNVEDKLSNRLFGDRVIIRLPALPRSIAPLEQIQGTASLLF